jgi:hypothetical protein
MGGHWRGHNRGLDGPFRLGFNAVFGSRTSTLPGALHFCEPSLNAVAVASDAAHTLFESAPIARVANHRTNTGFCGAIVTC